MRSILFPIMITDFNELSQPIYRFWSLSAVHYLHGLESDSLGDDNRVWETQWQIQYSSS